MKYEYAILHHRSPQETHGEGWTEEQAQQWLDEWAEMAGTQSPYALYRREVGEWEKVCG